MVPSGSAVPDVPSITKEDPTNITVTELPDLEQVHKEKPKNNGEAGEKKLMAFRLNSDKNGIFMSHRFLYMTTRLL